MPEPLVILAFSISMFLIHHSCNLRDTKSFGVPDSDATTQLGFLEPQLQQQAILYCTICCMLSNNIDSHDLWYIMGPMIPEEITDSTVQGLMWAVKSYTSHTLLAFVNAGDKSACSEEPDIRPCFGPVHIT